MSEKHWIATWGTAQQLAPAAESGGGPEMPADEPGEDHGEAAPTKVGSQTVRMKARATAGGAAVRVALSNAFGNQPVRIGAASLGSAVLTFGGLPAVTLPAGALIYSDPLEITVAAQTDLTVDLYVPDEAVIPTTHELGLRTAWLAPGDQTGAAALTGATTFASYLWLTGIDVLAEPDTATIVAFGDSLVDGMGTTPGADASWPSELARRPAAHGHAVINMGVSGNRLLRETDGLGAAGLSRFDRDVLARPGVRWVVLAEGLNDMLFGLLPGMPESERATAADIVAGYRMLIGRAHQHGLQIIGCTLMPVGGAPVFTEELESIRQAVNGWIRGSDEFEAVADLDAATRDPAAPDRVRAGLLSADGVHPNDAGSAVLAGAFGPGVFQFPVPRDAMKAGG
jgi:lysophospholipase L1-like esterase